MIAITITLGLSLQHSSSRRSYDGENVAEGGRNATAVAGMCPADAAGNGDP